MVEDGVVEENGGDGTVHKQSKPPKELKFRGEYTPSVRHDPCRHRWRLFSILFSVVISHCVPSAHPVLLAGFVVPRKVRVGQLAIKMFSQFRRMMILLV